MSFGGGGTNANDMRIAEMEREERQAKLDAEAAERQRQADEAAEELRRWQNSLQGAFNSSIADAQQYFADMGVDPDKYLGKITNAATTKRSVVPELSTDLASYFSGLGQSVYDQQLTAERNQALRGFNDFARDGFARNLLADTADDATIAAITGEQRNIAMQSLQRLRDRGILSDSGYAAAVADLDQQNYGVKGAIEEITSALLEGGRSDLRNIASTGKSAANNLQLGEDFDAQVYNQQINDEVKNFFSSLGEKARGNITEDLFDISSAYQKGGESQGAGNGAYNLSAALGSFDDLDEEDDDDKNKTDDWFAQF